MRVLFFGLQERQNLTLLDLSQDELIRHAARLSVMDQRKIEFLAVLAHELRNPLAPIKNAVQLMGMLKLDLETAELREIVLRQVNQLVRLIDDLLDVSETSWRSASLRKKVVDIREVLHVAIETSIPHFDERKQTLLIDFGDMKKGAFVCVDPSRMIQVFTNLLNNASKFSNPMSDVSLKVWQAEGDVIVEIRDNGIGIRESDLEKVFQMFSQVQGNIERGGSGLGIGLMLVKALVELHGGKVTAESERLGKGSRFTVRLGEVTSSNGESSLSEPCESENLMSIRPLRILIVDDMRSLRTVFDRLLSKMGHDITAVQSGSAALEALHKSEFDLVFSDISMPGMTGYELARRIREMPQFAALPLFAVTGFGQVADRERAFAAGFDDHLTKPIDVDQINKLMAKIASCSNL
jgi:CheY-like chemotaxis protein